MAKRVKKKTRLNHPATRANTAPRVKTMTAKRALSPITTQARRS